MHPINRFLNSLAPFFMLGIALVAFAFGIVILAYLLLFGAIVGLLLFAINWIRQQKFLRKNKPPGKKNPGTTIDSDDWKVL